MELRHDMLVHGVYIVCTEHEGKRAGLAVAWATQVARKQILICIGQQSATRDLILASKAFGLSLLTRKQLDIARFFGSESSRKVDKLERFPFHRGPTGSPLLDDSAVTFDCKVVAVYEHENKKLIVGEIIAMECLESGYEPLLYRIEDYL